MHPYSTDFYPPAPILPVECVSPVSRRTVETLALVDSGSSTSVIPGGLVAQLHLIRVGFVNASGFGGRLIDAPIYSVLFRFYPTEPVYTRALTWDEDYALLGRDIINKWEVVLNGPQTALTIS